MAIELKNIAVGPNRPVDAPRTERARPATSQRADEPSAKAAEDSSRPGKMDTQSMSEAVKTLNTYMQSINRELNFSVDDATGHTIVKVIDSETDEVIRQIPPEEALALARRLIEQTEGKDVLIREKA